CLAACAQCSQTRDLHAAIADVVESPNSKMLAARWRPFHHLALRRDQGPRFRRAQCRHVSNAGLRRALDRNALAVAKSWSSALSAVVRDWHANARGGVSRWRSDFHFLRHCAIAGWPG